MFYGYNPGGNLGGGNKPIEKYNLFFFLKFLKKSGGGSVNLTINSVSPNIVITPRLIAYYILLSDVRLFISGRSDVKWLAYHHLNKLQPIVTTTGQEVYFKKTIDLFGSGIN